MAGSLIKVDEFTISSPVASVILGGANWDSSYDVYKVVVNNVSPATANIFRARITKDVTGTPTPQTTTNYDFALKRFKTSGIFENNYNSNQNYIDVTDSFVNASTGNANLIMYIFNANNSSEYTFATTEVSQYTYAPSLRGQQGGFVFTVASAVDGINFFTNADNFASGTFTLYGLAK